MYTSVEVYHKAAEEAMRAGLALLWEGAQRCYYNRQMTSKKGNANQLDVYWTFRREQVSALDNKTLTFQQHVGLACLMAPKKCRFYIKVWH